MESWTPQWAVWTTSTIRRKGWAAGVPRSGPQLGLLTWVKDGVEDPFAEDIGQKVHGGTLHGFAER